MTEETQPEVRPGVPLIHSRLAAIARDLPGIARAGEMTLGSNTVKFTKIADIRDALYPFMDTHGVMLYPYFIEQISTVDQAEEPWTTGGDKQVKVGDEVQTVYIEPRPVRDGRIPTTRFREKVVYDFNLVCVDDASCMTVRIIGEAIDTSSDKATGKATTAAVKRLFTEVFRVVDSDEKDIEESNPEDQNRAATTDRREGGDRSNQMRQRAASGGASQRRSISTSPAKAMQQAAAPDADQETGELPEPNEPPEQTKLDAEKSRVKGLIATIGYDPHEVDALATELTGVPNRMGENGWITKITHVKKLGDELEKRIKAKAADGA